ncbi:MAG: pyruvate dehydrogenase E2 component (dihydrolipoamide acetyltransferase) [Spirosomataceae bacterium]|jgi:pyruvate dehydrogenase E2 component (dihydrolipoamide acetyltransferase)
MAEVIRMPKMSDTMEEGVIANWNVKVGDKVDSGDILAEIETDKATMDMESYEEGTILYIGVEKGEAVPINAIMAVIGEEGEDFQSLLDDDSSGDDSTEEDPKEEIETATPEKSSTKIEEETDEIDTSNIEAAIIRMPKMSDTMEEGVIHTWLKKVGDKIEAGDMLAEVETDKATMELEAYEEGMLLYIGVKDGASVPVDGIIAVVGTEGADFETLLKADEQKRAPKAEKPKEEAPKKEKTAEKSKEPKPAKEAAPQATTPTANTNGRVIASPLAKRLAEEKGIDIQAVSGSGPSGRIIKIDIDNFVPAAAPQAATPAASNVTIAAPVGEESFTKMNISQMRKAISRGFNPELPAPEFFVTMEINMDKAISARKTMNEMSPVKISFNDMIIKASAVALSKHPMVNSSWRGDHIRQNQHVHIGMAVAVEEGLLMPVIRFANTLQLSQLAATTKDLGGKAKNKQLQPKDWEGNTFTVSNLGMFGVDQFTSIINNRNNESCILAVGGIKETVAVKDGNFYATNIMKVTLTCDHRVVDGATGAAFLVTLRELLEEPYKLLV